MRVRDAAIFRDERWRTTRALIDFAARSLAYIGLILGLLLAVNSLVVTA